MSIIVKILITLFVAALAYGLSRLVLNEFWSFIVALGFAIATYVGTDRRYPAA